jgi:phosphonate transport system substrate-binding protein
MNGFIGGGAANVPSVSVNYSRALRRALSLLALSGIGAIACAQGTADNAAGKARSSAKEITVSIIAPRGVDRARNDWTPLIDDMALALKAKVNLRVGANAKEVVDDMTSGRAQIAWVGNKPALEIVESRAGDVFASMVRENGSTGYRSVIIVRNDSSVKTVADLLDPLRKLAFGAGDPKSTSGYVIPNYYVFARNKVRPEDVFAKILVGNHQENAQRVASGDVHAATCNDSELDTFRQKNPTDAAKLRVLWKSNEIPESPLMWSKSLDNATKQRVRSFFVEYGKNESEREKLKTINNLKRFRASGNRQLLAIADIEMFSARTSIDRDTTLNDEQRAAAHVAVLKRASLLETALRVKN